MRKGGRERERRARERERESGREREKERGSGEGVRDIVPRQGHSGRGPAAVEGAFVFHLLVKAAVK